MEGGVVGVSDGDTSPCSTPRSSSTRSASPASTPPSAGSRTATPRSRTSPNWTFTRLVEARCYKRDRYGRDVCRVFIGAGQDAGLEQIRAGMAWWFREYANEQTPQERQAYQAAEEAAKAEARGLWWEAETGAAVGVAKKNCAYWDYNASRKRAFSRLKQPFINVI